MKKTLVSFAAVSLMSVAGFASAAEPMQLTEMQMDTVAAGNTNGNGGVLILNSYAGGKAFALVGDAHSNSENKVYGFGVVMKSKNHSHAKGFFAKAQSNAGSQLIIVH